MNNDSASAVQEAARARPGLSPRVMVGLGSSQNAYIKILTPRAPVCDHVWGQDVYRGIPVKAKSLVWVLIPYDG